MQPSDLCTQSAHQVRQRLRTCWLLSASQCGRLPVCAQEDSRQHDLLVSRINQRLCFIETIIDRLAPQRRPKLGDDAVGAVRVTAILDFQERALMRGLSRVEKRKCMRA